MPALKFYRCFSVDFMNRLHSFNVDTLKMALTSRAPDVKADVILADADELDGGNGYTSGGEDVRASIASDGRSLIGFAPVWTARGGPIGPFKYVVLYNATAKRLIGFWSCGKTITLEPGRTFLPGLASGVLLSLP